MPTIKELTRTGDLFTSGHRACAGCGGTIILRLLMANAGKNTVVGAATGCMEVVSTIYPYTSWDVNFVHNDKSYQVCILSDYKPLIVMLHIEFY